MKKNYIMDRNLSYKNQNTEKVQDIMIMEKDFTVQNR